MTSTFCDMDDLWRVSFAGEASYRGAYEYNNHRRINEARAVLQYTLAGTLDWHDDNGACEIPANHFVLFTLDEHSRFSRAAHAGTYHCRWVSLAGSGIDTCWRGIIAHYGRIHGPDDGSVLRILQGLRTDSTASSVHNALATLHDWLDRRRNPPILPVEQAIEYIENNAFAHYAVSEIAATFDVSREHLSLCFRKRHQQAPGNWLLQRRLEFARELLAHGSLSLSEVATQCGMGNARRLSRALQRTLA